MKNSNGRDARYWIEKLGLAPHPEGGYFRQTYKSGLVIPGNALSHPGARAASTAIYFLLERENFSAFHRLRSDEMWHFYAGSPLTVHVISPAGAYSNVVLGSDPEAGQVFQAVVLAGCWFGAEGAKNSHFSQNRREMGHPLFSLVGCTVAPGFEFDDFEMATREELIKAYPQHADVIRRLTRSS
jgi:predicted cupin superfamily sugar epimerase